MVWPKARWISRFALAASMANSQRPSLASWSILIHAARDLGIKIRAWVSRLVAQNGRQFGEPDASSEFQSCRLSERARAGNQPGFRAQALAPRRRHFGDEAMAG
jgi:hypothetical protein